MPCEVNVLISNCSVSKLTVLRLRYNFATCSIEKFALVVKMLRLKVWHEHSPDSRPPFQHRGVVIKKVALQTCNLRRRKILSVCWAIASQSLSRRCPDVKERRVDVAVARPMRYFKDPIGGWRGCPSIKSWSKNRQNFYVLNCEILDLLISVLVLQPLFNFRIIIRINN